MLSQLCMLIDGEFEMPYTTSEEPRLLRYVIAGSWSLSATSGGARRTFYGLLNAAFRTLCLLT